MIRKQTKLWTTREGERIRICDMSDNHLINTAKMVIRTATKICIDQLDTMMSVPPPTADIASMMFDQEFDQALEATWADHVPEIFWALWDDLGRRGIQERANNVLQA